MQDDPDIFTYEFEQLQLDMLRRIHKADQRKIWFEQHKQKFLYFAYIVAFCIGYILGILTK